MTPQQWLKAEAAHDTTEGDCAQLVVELLARQRAEIRRLKREANAKDYALRCALAAFETKLTYATAAIVCEEALGGRLLPAVGLAPKRRARK